MGSIVNFQYGEFIHSTPSCFDWFALILNLLFVAIGFVVAFSIYFKQQRDTAKEAYELFQDSLLILKDAVDKTIELLGNYTTGLANANDDFIQPSLPVNLNDGYLNRIDFTSLNRYYRTKRKFELENYKSFLTKSAFIGTYIPFFLNELNHFRTIFFHHEEKFKKYILLLNGKYFEVKRQNPLNSEFFREYADLRKSIMTRTDIFDSYNHSMKNRSLFNKDFIFPIGTIANKYIETDAIACDIFQLANEINAARGDIDILKDLEIKKATNDLNRFKEIKSLIDNLINYKLDSHK